MTRYPNRLVSYRLVPLTFVTGLLAALAAVFPMKAVAQEVMYRSMAAEPLYRQNDKRDLPRHVEKQTHRGWEFATPQYTVVSMSSYEDGKMAAQHFGQAWGETLRLMDPWTRMHQAPNFGWGSAEITIDNRPIKRASDQAAPMLQVNYNMMIVYVNVSPGRPSLQEQLPQLRMAAVCTLMHTSQLDQKLPVWVRDGLSVYVAEKCEEMNGGARTSNPPLLPLDTEYWTRKRVARDQLADRPPQTVDSGGQMRFLLEGYDCSYAPATFASIRETVDQANPGLTLEIRANQRGAQAFVRPTVVDLLMDRLRPKYDAWQRDPLAGQPIIKPIGNENPRLVYAEREIAVMLKLARRFGNKPNSGAGMDEMSRVNGANNTTTTSAGGMKITEFKQGRSEVIPAGRAPLPAPGPAPEGVAAAQSALRMQPFFERITSRPIPWATIDANGEVLMGFSGDRLQEIFGYNDGSVTFATGEKGLVIRKRLPEGGVIEGWLEDNPNQPSRPIANFARLGAGEIRR